MSTCWNDDGIWRLLPWPKVVTHWMVFRSFFRTLQSSKWTLDNETTTLPFLLIISQWQFNRQCNIWFVTLCNLLSLAIATIPYQKPPGSRFLNIWHVWYLRMEIVVILPRFLPVAVNNHNSTTHLRILWGEYLVAKSLRLDRTHAIVWGVAARSQL